MRRIKMIMGTAAVLVGMLALNAGPAMADELEDGFFNEDDFTSDEVLFVDEGTATFDELCSPFLPEGIFIPGCIFSDPIEEDFDDFDFDEEVIFFVEDFDFDEDDFDEDDSDFNDNNRNDNNRNGNFVG